jgi:type-F conjugative transfer system secretin TraK
MFKCITLLVLGLMTTVVYAEQQVPVQDGIEVTLSVSQNALNRIAVDNDRILTVKGISGQFELDKDAELGQIFLKPLTADSHDLIHLFLITEKGHTYPLSLTLTEGPAQSILLMPIEELAVHGKQSSHYETLLKNLVQAMVNETPLAGLTKSDKAVLKPVPKIQGLKISLLQSYSGYSLQAQILEVTNTGKETVILKESDFYQDGVRAVAILNPNLLAQTKTCVTVVR